MMVRWTGRTTATLSAYALRLASCSGPGTTH